MAKDKVTIQDIADALHLSRTTVSKALNGAPNMPAKTISAVWNKAKEMNPGTRFPQKREELLPFWPILSRSISI